MSKELTISEQGAYLTVAGGDSLAILQENLAPGEQLGPGDIPHITVPAGGGIAWEIPGDEGYDSVRTINAVIAHHSPARAFWRSGMEDTGGGTPPDCISNDGIMGEALTEDGPGGECASCPFNQWGSSTKGKGKACKETFALYLLRPNEAMPTLLRVPPTSLDAYKKYRLALTNQRLRYFDVETAISLEKVQNAGGITFGRIVFKKGRNLSEDEVAAVGAERAKIVEAMSA